MNAKKIKKLRKIMSKEEVRRVKRVCRRCDRRQADTFANVAAYVAMHEYKILPSNAQDNHPGTPAS